MTDTASKLPPKQEQALAALLTHANVRDAAAEAKVSEATLWRFLRDPAFSERYKQARREITDHLIARLQADSVRAAKILMDVAEDVSAHASARVSAARTVIEQALRGAELRDLTDRIEALEATQKGKG